MSHQHLPRTSIPNASLASLADRLLGSARSTFLSISWTPLTQLAEWAVLRTLGNLTKGVLRIVRQDGSVVQFPVALQPAPVSGPVAELRVVRDAFWLRLAFMGGLGFAEAYMFGDVSCTPGDLRAMFRIFLLNRSEMDAIDGTLARAFSALPNYLTTTRFANALGIARGNISAHYDISNKMFEGFLSRDMMYSCGIFGELDADLRRPGLQRALSTTDELAGLKAHTLSETSSQAGESDSEAGDELHDAQLRKIRHILRRLKLAPGDRVLEIGTGWGEFAIAAARAAPGVVVDTVTLSAEQKALAEDRIRAAGLEDRIAVHLLDYRALPREWAGRFDRFVSIEMIEHVGLEFLPTYFGVAHWALKPRDAVGVIQVSTMPESRVEAYRGSVDFIQKYIFPGCFLPTLTQLVDGLHAGSRAQFIVDTVDNMGPHYPRTLREWARRFEGCFVEVIAPELRKQYPDVMGDEELEIFRRKWLYYFYYCEAGFASRTLGNHTVTFTREATESYGCNIELPEV